MDFHALKSFLTVIQEKSFSKAARKLYRTQPAISLAIQKLEVDLGERLIDRSSNKELLVTDAGRLVAEFAQRLENLKLQLTNSLVELKDHSSGRLTIGANESTTLYLLIHLKNYRSLYPRVKIEVRRSFSSRIPADIMTGNLELGMVSYDPSIKGLASTVIYTDALAFVVSPKHRLANRKAISIQELGLENFIAHNVISPYRQIVLREFARHKVSLNMGIEMPTIESIRKLVQNNEGVAFIPRMCVEEEIASGTLRTIKVKELHVERKIRLLYPTSRTMSYAARAFLDLVKG